MRFAHGWPIERDSPLLSLSSLCSSSSSEDDEDEHERRLLLDDDDETNEKHQRKATTTSSEEEERRRRRKARKEKKSKKKNIIVSTSLDQTSRMLAIVTSTGGIELWDSGQNRTLLCAKMKSSSSAAASEYVCAEWKPNYYEENDVNDDDDESMSASHKERTLLVLTRAGNVLVFLVSVGNVEEFGRSSENNTSNNNNNNAGGGGGGSEQRCGTMRSASCVLKRAIKVKVVSNPSSSSSPSHDSNNNNLAPEEEGLETSSASASSVATTFAFAKDGQGVFFGTSRGGLAYADVFPKGKLYATTHSSDLVLKEILVANDVCAALAPKHHRRRTSRMSWVMLQATKSTKMRTTKNERISNSKIDILTKTKRNTFEV